MVKNVFSNLSRGFFYTIGRIIAIAFILLVIGTLIAKFGDDQLPDFFGGDGLSKSNSILYP